MSTTISAIRLTVTVIGSGRVGSSTVQVMRDGPWMRSQPGSRAAPGQRGCNNGQEDSLGKNSAYTAFTAA